MVAVALCTLAAVVAFVPKYGGNTEPVARTTTSSMETSSATSSAPPSASTSASGSAPGSGPTWAPTTPNPQIDEQTKAPSAPPVSVAIPSIAVGSNLIKLGTDPATGVLIPPKAYDIAGWFADGPVPGDLGPAVIAGHVDSQAGPGVFYKLKNVAVGDPIYVTLADATVVTFVAIKVAHYPKSGFPTADVYGPTPDAELRVITCGGTFDYSKRSYVDNIVVFAKRA